MVFANLIFLYLFVPINIIMYYISNNKNYRNMVLILFSLFFYAWGEPVWLVLLIFSATIDYFHGMLVEIFRNTIWAKLAVASSLILNLGLLIVFKYSGFLYENVNMIMGLQLEVPNFILPIGISFYTFQTISYVIDVYRGEVKAQRSYLKFLMFVSLYHQLVAGPIVRYSHVAKEIDNRSVTIFDIREGLTRFCIGLTKKVFIANVAGDFVLKYMETAPISTLGAWFGAIMFSFQIYYDFSGYSDMAIGLGRMFGFNYYENFNYPYIARSATDFWRRWHISLGSFFRDYVYIPMGGNRKHQYLNLLVVWFLTGLWHGASWNFIIWGLYFGALIMIEKLFLLKILSKIPRFVSHIYLIFAAIFGWVIFYFTDTSKLLNYLSIMFGLGGTPFGDIQLGIILMNNIFWIMIAVIFCMPVVQIIKKKVIENTLTDFLQIGMNIALILICSSLLVGQSFNPFLYFRF